MVKGVATELQTEHDLREQMHSKTMFISCLEEFGLSWGVRERRTRTNVSPQQVRSRWTSKVMNARAVKGPQKILGKAGKFFYFPSLQESRDAWFQV